jgi:DNA-binding NtrC family response regulator
LYKRFLSQIGYRNVSSFTDSSGFLKEIGEKPDLVFLDYYIDHLNGIDLLKVVKKKSPKTVIVLVSGQEDLIVAVNSLKEGAFDYIIKDEFTLEKMEMVINRAIEITTSWKKVERNLAIRQLVTATGFFSVSFFFQKLLSRP